MEKYMRTCVINVGLYRTGTTTLARAVEWTGCKTHRALLPSAIESATLKTLLLDPCQAVREWWKAGGRLQLEKLVQEFDFLCDGYMPWLLLLPDGTFDKFCDDMRHLGVSIRLIATQRILDSLIQSELHHWVRHDLEALAELKEIERSQLEQSLRHRALLHARVLQEHSIEILSLEDMDRWPARLERLIKQGSAKTWERALRASGRQNHSPQLPLEGILLTFRIGHDSATSWTKIQALLVDLIRDRLCNMIVILALDHDEADSPAAADLTKRMGKYCPVHRITNPQPQDSLSPFALCHVWDTMATLAFSKGCDWVMLLGDDITIDCSYHFRAIYRAFLDIEAKLLCPFGFGCPWWNDVSFPGFPTFPVIGKAHYSVFGRLIPSHRRHNFINQDLDPYLHRLYVTFGAAPLLTDVRLLNGAGGSHLHPTRYQRTAAVDWRNWVQEDVAALQSYLAPFTRYECLLLDVVVPTYRLDMEYLQRICSLSVPEHFQTTFIIIVDNPIRLQSLYPSATDPAAAAQLMERELSATCGGNHIRVRSHSVNAGASATRNHGLDESAAAYILLLDDDVLPDPRLLHSYESYVRRLPSDAVGLVGLVQFPRPADLSVVHAGVAMSHLTFMFEIAGEVDPCTPLAWGVTAHLLVRKSSVRFDTRYAKTGGGEDVDYCLRVAAESGGYWLPAAEAVVRHEYWAGGVWGIVSHVFLWATGDGALFSRYPRYCYRSWPNAVEYVCLVWWCVRVPLGMWWGWSWDVSSGPTWWLCGSMWHVVGVLVVDVVVDVCDRAAWADRCRRVGPSLCSGWWYYLAAHMLGNGYVWALECGRLYGHCVLRREWFHVCRRFDWHCGTRAMAPERFVARESRKFVGFLSLTALEVAWWWPPMGRDRVVWVMCVLVGCVTLVGTVTMRGPRLGQHKVIV